MKQLMVKHGNLSRLFAAVTVLAGASFATGQIEVAVGTTETAVVTPTPTPAPTSAPLLEPGAEHTSERMKAEGAAAEAAASKIAPAPGTALGSTEQPTLEMNQEAAPPPSLQFKGDEVVMNDGSTTEAMAIKSMAELLRTVGVRPRPKPADGLESEETTAALDFDVDAVRRVIGSEPRVVYRVVIDETPLPDPMIVPWIRNLRLLQEKFDKAVDLLANNRVDEGRTELLAIISDFPNSEHAVQARELLVRLDQEKSSENVPVPVIQKTPPPVEIQLNPDVRVGSVIADTSDPGMNRAMISGRVYRVGESLRGLPNHVVTAIAEDVVKVEVEVNGNTRTFDLPVRPGGS